MESYQIIKEFKGNNSRKMAIARMQFGLVKIDLINVKKGHKVGIRSALNKTDFFQKQLDFIYGKGRVYVVGEYIKGSNKIIVEIEKIKYNVLAKNILKQLPNVRSSDEKTALFINKASKVHSGKYNYSSTEYSGFHKHTNITFIK